MAEVLPRNVIISMVLVMFIFTAGIFMINQIYSGLGVSTPSAVTDLENNLSTTDSTIQSFAESTEGSFNSESSSGFVSASCTTLLGDDNFFCAGLQTLGSFTGATQNIKLVINLFGNSFPIEIPSWVISTLITVLVTIVVFVAISAYRRYQS